MNELEIALYIGYAFGAIVSVYVLAYVATFAFFEARAVFLKHDAKESAKADAKRILPKRHTPMKKLSDVLSPEENS